MSKLYRSQAKYRKTHYSPEKMSGWEYANFLAEGLEVKIDWNVCRYKTSKLIPLLLERDVDALVANGWVTSLMTDAERNEQKATIKKLTRSLGDLSEILGR